MDVNEMQRLLRASVQDALPEQALRACEELRDILRSREYELVVRLREEGATWDAIAGALGITRQSLQGRWETWSQGGLPPDPGVMEP